MKRTWSSTQEALAERIANCGLTWDQLAAESGVPKPSLHAFLTKGHGLHMGSVDKLLAYFGLVVVEKGAQ